MDGERILVVEDDAAVAWAVQQALTSCGYRVGIAASVDACLRQVKQIRPDLVLTDLRMPGRSGLDLINELRVSDPDLPVVLMTAYVSLSTAVDAVRHGASDVLGKPLDFELLRTLVGRILRDRHLAIRALPEAGQELDPQGTGPAMQTALRRLAAAVDAPCVLICGPSGCGKRTTANAFLRSCGRGSPMIVECAQVGEADAADMIAGIIGRAGATGAGVLMIEIAELPISGQDFLARQLAMAGAAPGIRLAVTTSRDLGHLASQGGFRHDLAERLQSVSVHLPALSARGEDLTDLVRQFLRRIASRRNQPLSMTDAALARIAAHPWPGNLRELGACLEGAAILARDGVIDLEHLGLEDLAATVWEPLMARIARDHLRISPGKVHAELLGTIERIVINEALAATQGNQMRAAALLGLNRTTLRRRLRAVDPTPTLNGIPP
ncbi:nitrogen regulation protein NR [Planctomycetota bacterium]|nr:nitrogen regulation protein NR [Planctomycetota bacterium]